MSAKTAMKQVDCIGVFKGAGALTSVHSKVTASVGDCLDQGCIFRR